MTAAMVDQAVSWGWWIGTLLTMAIGAVIGWAARVMVERERERDEYEDALRAARMYQREIDRARRRHPSYRGM